MERKFTTEPIVLLSYQSFTQNFRYYFLISLIFIAATTFIGFISEMFNTQGGFFQGLIFALAGILCYVKMAVMVHRSVLLNEYNLSKMLSWSSIEVKFFFWGVGIYLLVVLISGVIGAFAFPIFYKNNQIFAIVGFGIIFLIVSILCIRLSLIFPCVAVGKIATMAKSWEATKGHVISLFILIYALPILVNYPLTFLPEGPIWELLASVPSVLLTIIGVTMVSHCYHLLFEEDVKDDSVTII